MNYELKRMAEHRFFYEFKEKNKKGESLVVELTEVYYNNTCSSSLPNLWKEHGFTNKLYNNAIFINCYCYLPNGTCKEKYNPTIKLSEDKERNVINFDYLLEVNEENKNKLLKKIYKEFIKGGAKNE